MVCGIGMIDKFIVAVWVLKVVINGTKELFWMTHRRQMDLLLQEEILTGIVPSQYFIGMKTWDISMKIFML